MILLDLNLPRVTGYEVLKQIKSDEALNHIPVIILSGSEAPNDVNYCFAWNAAAYVVKPDSLESARLIVEAIERVWFVMGRTPRGD